MGLSTRTGPTSVAVNPNIGAGGLSPSEFFKQPRIRIQNMGVVGLVAHDILPKLRIEEATIPNVKVVSESPNEMAKRLYGEVIEGKLDRGRFFAAVKNNRELALAVSRDLEQLKLRKDGENGPTMAHNLASCSDNEIGYNIFRHGPKIMLLESRLSEKSDSTITVKNILSTFSDTKQMQKRMDREDKRLRKLVRLKPAA